MDHNECPHYKKAQSDATAFNDLAREIREEIEANMRALGLKPERMSAQVRSASLLGARSELLAMEVAVTPPTYEEVSREGNVKPVTHPLYIQATATATAYTNALKQLGIYASTEKVATRAQDKDQNENPLAGLINEINNEEV